MRLFIDYLQPHIFEEKLKNFAHIDFSLFVERLPQNNSELSSINIITLHEPNEYFGRHDWVIQNKHLFQLILTWNQRVLNNCPQAQYIAFGDSFLKPEQYSKDYAKQFEIAHLAGKLNKTYGQSLRHEILARQNEIKMPKRFFDVFGSREEPSQGKVDVFTQSQFGVAIENVQHSGWFTEKLIDLLLMKTIPIYWGDPNINMSFDMNGIVTFSCVDDLIHLSNNFIHGDFYEERKEAIETNFELAKKYLNYENRICDIIEGVFKHNKLI